MNEQDFPPTLYYILDADGKPIATTSVVEWAKWREYETKLRVVLTTLTNDICISTVFLGLDHGSSDKVDTRPTLWETMIFGGAEDGYQLRYKSKEDAIKGHWSAVAIAATALAKGE